jgi:hypothetical protein
MEGDTPSTGNSGYHGDDSSATIIWDDSTDVYWDGIYAIVQRALCRAHLTFPRPFRAAPYIPDAKGKPASTSQSFPPTG